MSLLKYYPLRSAESVAGPGLTISPKLIFKYTPTPGITVSVKVTATATFGTGPYTYLWTSDDPYEITITNATSAAATYSYTGTPPASTINSYGYLQCTDSLGTVKYLSFYITFQVGGLIL